MPFSRMDCEAWDVKKYDMDLVVSVQTAKLRKLTVDAGSDVGTTGGEGIAMQRNACKKTA